MIATTRQITGPGDNGQTNTYYDSITSGHVYT